MKQIQKVVCAIFFIAVSAQLGIISPVQSTFTESEGKAIDFIKNVLPIDSSKYNITLRNYGAPELPDIGYYKQSPIEQEIFTYSLKSKDSALDVICAFSNKILTIGSMYVVEGSVISDRQYSNLLDAAKDFLKKYQAYSKLDSTEMINMLSNVDPSKNATVTSGVLKLTVTHQDLSGTWFGDTVDFRWVQTFNGCDYLAVDLAFRDGVFSNIIDHRQLYSIGNTAVNISKEQAVKIAMEYVKNYSYEIAEGVWISDFNVTEERTVANLVPTVREANVLYPYWSITLYLNQTYPGSVTSLLLGIWADSGEVFFCHYQAYGGSNLILDGNSGYESPAMSPTSPTQENTKALIDPRMAVVISIAAIAIAVATTLLLKKEANRALTFLLFYFCKFYSK
ncbi:MAG: hypothetical protein QXJ76_03040 [Candidatus Bathyarchaeia archaeon]